MPQPLWHHAGEQRDLPAVAVVLVDEPQRPGAEVERRPRHMHGLVQTASQREHIACAGRMGVGDDDARLELVQQSGPHRDHRTLLELSRMSPTAPRYSSGCSRPTTCCVIAEPVS